MKKLFFIVLAHGMFASAFAQTENVSDDKRNSDQWEITPVESIKGVLGRLDINFAEDVERNILVHRQADDEFITSVSRNAKTFPIAPGIYRFVMSSVPIDNVPIQKGHETRLKAGYLNIVSEGDWFLYDDSQEKLYTSGNTPKKMPLPVGSYQIKLGGQFYPVRIKDGKTVEDFSDAKDNGLEISESKATDLVESRTDNQEKWIITKFTESNEKDKTSEQGRLAMKFPLYSPPFGFTIYRILEIHKSGEEGFIYRCGQEVSPCPSTYTLADGKYDIYFGPSNSATSLRPIIIRDVPIRRGHETSIKVGYLRHMASGWYYIFDESTQTPHTVYNSQGSSTQPFPIGRYRVGLKYVGDYQVEIKEGKIFQLDPRDSIATPPSLWKIDLFNGNDAKIPTGKGRLNTSFPNAENYAVSILPNTSGVGNAIVKLDTLESIDLLPGNYKVSLNYIHVVLPIESNKETKIRFGYIKLPDFSEPCTIYGAANHFGFNGARTIALPIGLYRIQIGLRSYLIKINEVETLNFSVTQ